MRIGYVLSNLLLGGAQLFMADLATAFSHRCEVKYTVLSMKRADPIVQQRFGNIQNVEPHELVRWSDIIHLDGLVSKQDKQIFKPKWKSTVEIAGSERNYSYVERVFKRNLPPYLIALSKHVGQSLRVKHRVIYGGVDTERFRPLDVDKKYDLVMIGRMRPIKNYELFIEICKNGGFSFLAIGGTHRRLEGHINDIEKMVKKNAVEGRDFVPGFVPNEEVVPLINQARMAIVVSHSEAIGFNTLEPMACGVPVIARSVGGVPEAFEDCPDVLVPYDAPAAAYIEKIKKYIHDDSLSKKMRHIVIEKFSRQKTIEAYADLYNEIIAKRNQ